MPGIRPLQPEENSPVIGMKMVPKGIFPLLAINNSFLQPRLNWFCTRSISPLIYFHFAKKFDPGVATETVMIHFQKPIDCGLIDSVFYFLYSFTHTQLLSHISAFLAIGFASEDSVFYSRVKPGMFDTIALLNKSASLTTFPHHFLLPFIQWVAILS